MSRFVFAVAICAALVGCAHRAPAERRQPSSAGTAAPPAARTQAATAALSEQRVVAERYLRLGVPAVDRRWSGRDYLRASEVIAGLQDMDLPRLQDPESAPVLVRFAEPDNFSFQRNKTLSLAARFAAMDQVLSAVSAVGKRYGTAMLADTSFGEEVMHVTGFGLRAVVIELELMAELIPTLNPSDPTYSTRMAGVEGMKLALAEMAQGALMMLEGRDAAPQTARQRFSQIVAASLPAMAVHLGAATRQEFRVVVARLAEAEEDHLVKTHLSQAAQHL